MLNDLNMWNKIGRIINRIAEQKNVDLLAAVDTFYMSQTCNALHDEQSGIYLMGDDYIVEDVMREEKKVKGER